MDNSVVAELDRQTDIKPKMQFTGKVVQTSLAGAKIDLGEGRTGLIHVSQLQTPEENQQILNVNNVLSVGQEITVWVRKIKDERIELTMFKPLDLEWREIKKGMTVHGKVVRLEGFGAFIDIGAERPGLIHISELAHGYVRTPADVVKEGEEIDAQVIDVNKKKKQIKLSLKALLPEPVIEVADAKLEPQARRTSDKSAAPRRTKKSPSRRRSEDGIENIDELMRDVNEPATEDEPTAMGIALLEAMDRAKARKQEDKKKKEKSVSSEREDIFSRTLETKQGPTA